MVVEDKKQTKHQEDEKRKEEILKNQQDIQRNIKLLSTTTDPAALKSIELQIQEKKDLNR